MSRSPNHRVAIPSPVLYTVVCGSPPAGHVGQLVALAQRAGWQVCVITTPDGRKFIDASALAAQTGFPVRSEYKQPGERDVLPAPDAIVVAPATVNTVNKWACGIADTLALGTLIEGYGLGLPIVVMPYTNTAMAAHPAFRQSLERLREWGVRVLFGDDVVMMPAPGSGSRQAVDFPWQSVLAAVGSSHRAWAGNTGRGPAGRPGQVTLAGLNQRTGRDGSRRLAPPSVPTAAPVTVRTPNQR